MPNEFSRSDRVAQTINRQLALILRKKVKDERVNSLTITDVAVTKDLRQAKIYVTATSVGDVDVKGIMAAVENASGYMRRELAAIIDMRHCPSLVFSYDNSISDGARMSALIDRALNKD